MKPTASNFFMTNAFIVVTFFLKQPDEAAYAQCAIGVALALEFALGVGDCAIAAAAASGPGMYSGGYVSRRQLSIISVSARDC